MAKIKETKSSPKKRKTPAKGKSSFLSKEKKTYHHDGLRQLLLEEAIRFLKTRPVQELSLREIARSLGVSHMAPYRHFPSKEELLAAVIEDGFHKLSARFRADSQKTYNSYHEMFISLGKNYVEFFLQNPDQARLMFSGVLCDKEKYPKPHEAGQETFGFLLQLIQKGQKEGHISPQENPYLLGLMIWSAVHGTAVLMLEDQFEMIDHAPEVQMDIFMNFMGQKILKGVR